MECKSGGEEGWDEEEYDYGDDSEEEKQSEKDKEEEKGGSREGKWESGKGRCAVTGRRVLGGTDGLRRVMA